MKKLDNNLKEQIHFNMCLKEILKKYLTEIFYTDIRTS